METTVTILGIKVSAVQIPDTIEQIKSWIEENSSCHYVAVTGMHGIMEAQNDPTLKLILNSANLNVPDGMPLIWIARRRGYPLKRRVYGPELMETFCRTTGAKFTHFFYGGSPGVAELLSNRLHEQYGIRTAGIFCPPFRPLTPAEEKEISEMIDNLHPDVLWVGLSTPKQERWMFEFQKNLRVPVLVGVGAAFDFLAGLKPSAPLWMKEHGLEWLFRLISEPGRLWKRYVINIPRFVYKVFCEEIAIKSK